MNIIATQGAGHTFQELGPAVWLFVAGWVVVRDSSGTQIATDTITLNPNGHYAFTLGIDRYPPTLTIRGTIEFDKPANAQIGALGIRIPNVAAHTYTTLPALAK